MEIVNVGGSAPGAVHATVWHDGRVLQLAMDVHCHPAGGWRVLRRDGEFGPRCTSVTTAALIEASEAVLSLEQPASERLALLPDRAMDKPMSIGADD